MTLSLRTLVSAIAGAALLAQAAPASAAVQEWTWPVRGRVITPYSNDNSKPYAGGMHRGIDIAAPVGTDVVAAHAGRVTYAAPLGSSGLTVAVRSSDDRHVASYLHLSRITVGRDETVAPGHKIGEVGTTGTRSTAEPHLHFGVRLAEREHFYLDPLALLPPLGVGGHDATPGAPLAAPLRAQVAPAPGTVRPLAVAAPRAHPVAGQRPVPAPGMLPFPRPIPTRRPITPAGPLPERATVAGRIPLSPAGGRIDRRPDHGFASVPAGPRLPVVRPVVAPRLPAPVGVDPADSSPGNWGTLISLGGVALLAGALTRRARSSPSAAARRHQRTKPGTRPAHRSQAPAVGVVSQMG